ncbi:MAG: Gldg family protein, partial [Bdellovibrionales bacterium]|nr:Gldg family protein [Bdellovibrionales bacterium]
VIKKIDGSVTFSLVAGRSTEEGTQALELVNRYARALPTARTTMLDPRKSPELQKRFGLTASDALVILYRNDEGKEFQKKLSSISERTITAALRSFVSPSRSVYVTQGNGEPSLNDSGAAGLTKMVAYAADQGFDVKPLLLPAVGAMPDDASLVVVLSPQKNFSDRERMLVEHYFSQGGNAMFLQDPDSSNAIPQLALQFGIGFSRSVVLDQEDLMYGADPIGWQLLLKDFSGHAITRSMSSNKFAVFLIASPLRLLEEYKQDRKYHTILSSGARSWAERDLEILNQENPEAHFNEGEDMRGPFPLAVAAEFTTGSQVLAFGDSQWVQNVNVDLFSHRELWLSSLQWASRAPFAMIPTRQMKFSYMPIGQGFYNVLLMLCYILPELVVIFGLLLHHGRSKRWQLA